MQTAQATQSIAGSMQKTTAVMEAMGKNMSPQQMQKTMQQFAMENQKMDMSSEMIDDAISDALDSDEMEGETDDVVSQVHSEASTLLQHSNKYLVLMASMPVQVPAGCVTFSCSWDSFLQKCQCKCAL